MYIYDVSLTLEMWRFKRKHKYCPLLENKKSFISLKKQKYWLDFRLALVKPY